MLIAVRLDFSVVSLRAIIGKAELPVTYVVRQTLALINQVVVINWYRVCSEYLLVIGERKLWCFFGLFSAEF